MPDAHLTLRELADAAFRQAAVKVVRTAREHGTPVVLWDDATGTVRYVSPEECEALDRLAETSERHSIKGVASPEPGPIPHR